MRMVELDGRYFLPVNITAVFRDEDEEGTVLELVGGNRTSVPFPVAQVVSRINDALTGGVAAEVSGRHRGG